MAEGRCPRLSVTMPPRHGKSELTSCYFVAWYLIRHPDRRVILASYSATLAKEFGGKVRDLIQENGGRHGVEIRRDASAKDNWTIAGHGGGMRATGVEGSVTGRGADLLIIDDPLKDAKQAQSEVRRQQVWDWWQSTSSTRLEPNGAVVVIHTRWHEEDLIGRLLARAKGGDGATEAVPWAEANLPAVARDDDPLGRARGEALWPQRYDRRRLDEIRWEVGEHWWAALYDQDPKPRDGTLFKREHWPIRPPTEAMARSARVWDLGATDDAGDWTVGSLCGLTPSDQFAVADVVRARLDPARRDELILKTAERDGHDVPVVLEQEPGSGGKAQVQAIARKLAGWKVVKLPSQGDKVLRADPLASYAGHGLAFLHPGDWNQVLLDELCGFPYGAHDDQVDSLSAAFRYLTKSKPAPCYG